MVAYVGSMYQRMFPPVPDDIEDEFACVSYARLSALVPLLYALLILSTLCSSIALGGNLSPLLQYAAPFAFAGICAIRIIVWRELRSSIVSPAEAKSRIATTFWIAIALTAACSIWTLLNWYAAEPGTRGYSAVFMIISTYAGCICLAPVRRIAFACGAAGILPISLVLIGTGDRIQLSFGIAFIATAIFLFRLISQQHHQLVQTLQLQRKIEELAHTDPLTRLPNRRRFFERAETELSQGRPFSIAILDLDGFKPVNDRLGHLAGDELLVALAGRLQNAVSNGILVARIGGDEFGLIFPARMDQATVASWTTALLASLAAPFVVGGRRVSVTASIGIARATSDGSTLKDLLEVADKALYDAKASGLPAPTSTHARAA